MTPSHNAVTHCNVLFYKIYHDVADSRHYCSPETYMVSYTGGSHLLALCKILDIDKKEELAQRIANLNMTFERDIGLGKHDLPNLFPDLELVNKVGPRSRSLFRILQFNNNWLVNPAKTWDSDPDFCKLYSYVKFLKVVNDISERGIKLCSFSYKS